MQFTKSPANPIIRRDLSSTWRQDLVSDPSVLQLDDEMRLYIRGRKHVENQYDGPSLVGSTFIGMFTIPVDQFDGVTWHEHAGNPVMEPGAPGSVDDIGPFAGNIVQVDGRYLLYCTGCNHRWQIDFDKGIGKGGKCTTVAVSDDGLGFKRLGDEPLLPDGTSAAVVVQHEGQFHLFFNRMNRDAHQTRTHDLSVIRSDDPYHFDIDGAQIALPPGPPGSWDSFTVQNPRVFLDQGVWYMVYAGSDRYVDNPHHFGVAASNDLKNWVRYSDNPVLSRGPEGQWDDCSMWPGSIIRVGDTYYGWYEGRSCGESQAAADARATGRGKGGYSQVGLYTLEAEVFCFR